MKDTISKITEYLFDCDFFDDTFDPEDEEVHLRTAEKLLRHYPWQEIWPIWNRFLHERCKTAEEVINFANLFYYYEGSYEYIPDPYAFVGYILYKVDIHQYWELAGDMLDSLFIAVLERAGKVDIMKDPYYRAWEDPNVLAEVEHYRQEEQSNGA